MVAAALVSSQTLAMTNAIDPPKFAALSLIGGKFNLVTSQPGTGSNIDRNYRQSVSLPGDPFDVTALGAIQEAIRSARGPQDVLLYTTPSKELADKPSALFDGSRIVLPATLLNGIKREGASHLLLLTSYRQRAALEIQEGTAGSGFLEGVGYYVDRQQRMMRTDTFEEGTGFLASFVYLQLSLIDLKTERVVQQRAINASTVLSAARNKDGFDPWGILSPDEKVDKLNRTIRSELQRAVPDLVRSL